MLKNTFRHIPGISHEAEQVIWKSNVHDWDQFLEQHHKIPIGLLKKQRMQNHIQESIHALENHDHNFFMKCLPSNLHWRLYPDMKPCFLDIETTGLSRHYDDLTVIGLYDGCKSKFFVKNDNLDEFSNEIQKYNLIVTYNGKCFDVPFLKSKFPDIDFDKFHIDLRFAMKELGYSGGLKYIERAVGIARDDDIKDVSGFEAVRLWYKHMKGDSDALDTLIKYNRADIENLKTLMDFTFKKLKAKHFLSIIE